jgi:hypothetical protein
MYSLFYIASFYTSYSYSLWVQTDIKALARTGFLLQRLETEKVIPFKIRLLFTTYYTYQDLINFHS